ncbi:MAG: carboxypeptidase regulatory-like domain-containing protein [Bacteroidota bacterium]
MLRNFILTTLLIVVVQFVYAQRLTGNVKDAVSGEPLIGANVILDDTISLAVTDINGAYAFEQVEPGRHRVTVSYVGYKSGVVYDVWVKNGKVTNEDISLNADPKGLPDLVITEPRKLNEIGKMTITEEQINRFAATYYDPARLVTISPDVAVSNDQNNRISVRGISPNYNVWRLEDVEIVNPNHLSNAGTFSDQPTSTGGGVNILSAQMLDRSSFLYSGYSSEYSNSVGGIFDMHLKKGNKDERQYTAQASLIGFDFSAEGPFSKSGDASYIVNYRYSFTGLLTSMGVDFGGESIGFQDLSFNINKPLGEKGSISFFGVGGLNFNNFDAKPFEESEVQKDRSDIYYDGKMGALGLKLNYQLGSGTWMLSGAVSSSDNDRDQNYYDQNQVNFANTKSSTGNQIYSFNTHYKFNIGKTQATVGSLLSIYQYRYLNQNTGSFTGSSPFIITYVDAKDDIQYSLINPYVNFTYHFFNFMQFDFGANYNWSPDNDQQVNPRAKLTVFTSPRSELYFSAGTYSQLLNPSNYYFVYEPSGGDYYTTYRDFNLMKSLRFTAGYKVGVKNWSYNLEGFYYDFPEVNINATGFGNTAAARSYGVSLMGTRSFIQNWYMNFGASLFESTWDDNMPNRYNLKRNVHASAGKEWFFDGKPIKRSLSINGKVIYQGGMVDPIVETAVMGPPSTANSDYLRFDLRVQWTRYHENRTASVSLDLQNLTNNENAGYTYYDSFTGQRESQTQLGMIPILTYRMEF